MSQIYLNKGHVDAALAKVCAPKARTTYKRHDVDNVEEKVEELKGED